MAPPTVLIVGGFLTAPVLYRPLRARLLARGAGDVQIAAVWPPDWLVAGVVGFGPLLTRVGRAVVATYRAGDRRPIIAIGHSGGGLLLRLAMSHVAYRGRHAGVAEAIGCLVTLGTPHGLGSLAVRRRHAGHHAASFLAATTPGAYFAPRTAYLSVGGAMPPRALEAGRRLAGPIDFVFRRLIGESFATAPGDGIVPASAVHLAGAEQLTFDDVSHGVIGRRWYADEDVVDRWWPTAMRLWRDALDARMASAAGMPAPLSDRSA